MKVILATGLAQPKKISNGLATIRRRILEANPSASVAVYSWREYEWIPEIARQMVSETLVMAGHSWGVWFLARLAKELERRGIDVDILLSADGVNRPPKEPLRIPSNVLEFQSWRQTKGQIRGSQICVSEFTDYSVHAKVEVRHSQVDEVKEFQDAVVRYATIPEHGCTATNPR